MSRFKDILPYFFALNYFNRLHNSGNTSKPGTSAERMKAWCKRKENRNKENERKKERYQANEKELTEDECDKKKGIWSFTERKIAQKSK